MQLKLDPDNTEITQFGVGSFTKQGGKFFAVPINVSVKQALRGMVKVTFEAMKKDSAQSKQYDPSDEQAAKKYLHFPTNHAWCKRLRDLHEAVNLRSSINALKNPADISYYFAKLADDQENRWTAVRRSSQFKGALKKSVISEITGTLGIVDQSIFLLDSDFDLIIDNDTVHILKPKAFESLANLKQIILAAAVSNIKKIKRELSFVNFDPIQAYAVKHIRAAQSIASIRSQNLKGITSKNLKLECQKYNVNVSINNGQIEINRQDVSEFLDILDRRLYTDGLIPNKPERFKAASRKKLP